VPRRCSRRPARRLRGFAAAIRTALGDGESVRPAGVLHAERALDRITEHSLADRAATRVDRARMALRLLRWLTTTEPAVTTVADAVAAQVDDGGWVDRARSDVWAGDPGGDQRVIEAYQKIYAPVTARRERRDTSFATLLARHTGADAASGERLWHIEESSTWRGSGPSCSSSSTA
jgi:hypothetical protein